MNDAMHDRLLLGAYALGALEADEKHAVDEHLLSCPECRSELDGLAATTGLLGDLPPEAFLDGPPDGGDLLLQRTLRQVRTEVAAAAGVTAGRAAPARTGQRRFALVAAAAAVLVAVSLGSGVFVGRRSVSTQAAAPTAVATTPASPAASVPGTRKVTAIDPNSGARMTATLIPAAGWVRIQADVGGVKAGQRCRLLVVSRSAGVVQAGSWLVSSKGEQNGTLLDGTALVAADDVRSVDVVTYEGVKLVSATF